MPVALGDYVIPQTQYVLCQAVELASPAPDPVWGLITVGAEVPAYLRCVASLLYRVASFGLPPAGYTLGSIVEVQENGAFWFRPPGPSVRQGRGNLVYEVSVEDNAGVPLGSYAWIALENNGPVILADWRQLTMIRPNVPIP